MFAIFKPVPVYIKLFSDKIEIVRLDTGAKVTREAEAPFSNPRLVVADFLHAEALVRSILKDLIKSFFIFQKSLEIVIQQMEKLEGGLSTVEMRSLRDLGEMVGARKVIIWTHEEGLDPQQALSVLRTSKQ